MVKFAYFAGLAALAMVPIIAHAQGAPVKIFEGKMIYGANGRRLAPVYRVNADGSVQFIMANRLLTVPSAFLTNINGRLTSSQTKAQLLR